MALGDRFHVNPGFERLDAALALNRKAGAHLWVMATTFGMTDQEAAHGHEGVDVIMDEAHLLSVTPVFCYRCEKPYQEALGQPCVEIPPQQPHAQA